MKVSDLKDGQKVKTLDDLYYIDLSGELHSYSTDDCYAQLTGKLLKEMVKIASTGDIGIYNEEFNALKFLHPTEDDPLHEEEYIFCDGDDYDEDLDLFEIVEE